VKPTGVLASLPVSFTVDTSQAGVADVDILIEVITHSHSTHLLVRIASTAGRRGLLLQVLHACSLYWFASSAEL